MFSLIQKIKDFLKEISNYEAKEEDMHITDLTWGE